MMICSEDILSYWRWTDDRSAVPFLLALHVCLRVFQPQTQERAYFRSSCDSKHGWLMNHASSMWQGPRTYRSSIYSRNGPSTHRDRSYLQITRLKHCNTFVESAKPNKIRAGTHIVIVRRHVVHASGTIRSRCPGQALQPLLLQAVRALRAP